MYHFGGKFNRCRHQSRLAVFLVVPEKLVLTVDSRLLQAIMTDEKLIELVRDYEELYDMSNRRYSDNYVKDKM